MAASLLSSGRARARAAIVFVSLTGCPHDWSRFERVDDVASDAGTAGPVDGGPEGASADVGAARPTPTMEVFATLPGNPTLVAADVDGVVVATAAGTIVSCPHASPDCAAKTEIARDQHDVRALALGYGHVAWTARGDHAVRRTARGGGASIEEALDDDGLLAVGLTASEMYFSVDAIGVVVGTPGIRRCSPGLDCQSPVFGGFADGVVTALAVDGTEAFWLGEGAVLGCRVADCEGDPGRRSLLVSEPVFPLALAVDALDVVYATPNDGGSLRAVARASALAAPATRTLATHLGAVTRVVLTGRDAWITSGAAGTVSRVARDGSGVTAIAANVASPSGLAVGGGYVYASAAGDGRVLRWRDD